MCISVMSESTLQTRVLQLRQGRALCPSSPPWEGMSLLLLWSQHSALSCPSHSILSHATGLAMVAAEGPKAGHGAGVL